MTYIPPAAKKIGIYRIFLKIMGVFSKKSSYILFEDIEKSVIQHAIFIRNARLGKNIFFGGLI
ncbi:MAG: hypothetical protein FWG46_04070 [Treponema sp.]|nr:hypothetical protein [Treponema sp.]